MYKNFNNYFILCTLSFFIISCTQSPKSERAIVEDKRVVLKEYDINATHPIMKERSKIEWIETKKTGNNHIGTVGIREGNLITKNGQLVRGNFVIDMQDIKILTIKDSIENEQNIERLKTHGFFEINKYPTAKFEIVGIKVFQKADSLNQKNNLDKSYSIENPTHWIIGNLTLKNSARSITFPAEIIYNEKNLIVVNTKFNLDKNQWNLIYTPKDAIQNKIAFPEVNVGLTIVAKTSDKE